MSGNMVSTIYRLMLAIFTEQKNTNWLTYILEEFKRINKAEFNITVTNDSEQISRFKNVITYSASFHEGFSIFDSNRKEHGCIIDNLGENIYCLSGTISENKSYTIPFDLFWNAFMSLSRLEEFKTEEKGKLIRSYLKNHPRNHSNIVKKPIVNYLFDFLEKKISQFFPLLRFSPFSKPIIELSHDIDYIEKTIQLRGKQTVFNAYNFFRNIPKKESLYYLNKTFTFLFSSPSYWCFDYWIELEKSMNKRSVFYIYSQLKYSKGFKSWIIDPSYNILLNTQLQEQLKKMHDLGFEIGLHGSYNSANIPGLLGEEKANLEKALGFPIEKTRQHWLNYRELRTPYFHNELFRYDSTLGWNDAIGFRSGLASLYRPYDHINDKPFSFFEVPQIIMDSTIFDYYAGNITDSQSEAECLLKNLSLFKSTHISVSWHQRVCSSDYNWVGLYERIVKNEI
jgi:hypothetical protein